MVDIEQFFYHFSRFRLTFLNGYQGEYRCKIFQKKHQTWEVLNEDFIQIASNRGNIG